MKDPKPLALCLALGFVLSGCHWSKDARQIKGELQACESNIKNIGVACEMYSTDWYGAYPDQGGLSMLTPNYLKTIPECPSAGRVTYEYHTGAVETNVTGRSDYFFINCQGEHHSAAGVSGNFPAYDEVLGPVRDQESLSKALEELKSSTTNERTSVEK